MNLNSIIFAAPHSSYDKETLQDELLWIPKKNKSTNVLQNVKLRSASQEKAANPNIERSSKRKFSRIYKISQEDANLVDTQEISNRIQGCINSSEFPVRTRRDDFDLQEISFSKPSPNSRGSSPQTTQGKFLVIRNLESKLIQETTESKDISLGSLDLTKKQYHSLDGAKDSIESKFKSHSKSIGCFPFTRRRKSSKSAKDDTNHDKNSNQLAKRNSKPEIKAIKTNAEESNTRQSPTTFKSEESAKNDYKVDITLDAGQGEIPCLMLKNKTLTSKYLIYFHANNEDIYLSYDLLDHLKRALKVNVIAGEYPGYGIYKGSASESKIVADAESIYEFVLDHFKAKEEEIIIFGRSIGSGPAVHLASRHNPGALILVSSFTSVRDIAKDRVGILGKYLVKNRFKNLESIRCVNSPTLVIHGQKDEIISHTHAQKLFDACKTKKKIEIRQEMSHNQFDFHDDMSIPISQFLDEAIGNSFTETKKEGSQLNSFVKLEVTN